MGWFNRSDRSDSEGPIGEWRRSSLDIAVDRVNEQRAVAVAHFGNLGHINADLLFGYELGFLWGLFMQLTQLCPVEVEPEKEAEALVKLFFVYRGFEDRDAQKVAKGAVQEARSNSKSFANLIALGAGAVANPPGVERGMVAYLKLASLG